MGHTVSTFDAELEALDRGIAEMGGIAETMTAMSIESLTRQSSRAANEVIALDTRLDALQRDIEERAVLTIARRQPMAVDLRAIVGAIRVAGDLERVGDLAKNTAKRVLALSAGFQATRLVGGIETMAGLVLGQLKDVLDAYRDGDETKALSVWKRDGEVDALYTSLFRELLTYMMEDPRNIGPCTHLLFAAKNVERIGDHTTNVAETVHYVSTGEVILGERPKGDRTSGAMSDLMGDTAGGEA